MVAHASNDDILSKTFDNEALSAKLDSLLQANRESLCAAIKSVTNVRSSMENILRLLKVFEDRVAAAEEDHRHGCGHAADSGLFIVCRRKAFQRCAVPGSAPPSSRPRPKTGTRGMAFPFPAFEGPYEQCAPLARGTPASPTSTAVRLATLPKSHPIHSFIVRAMRRPPRYHRSPLHELFSAFPDVLDMETIHPAMKSKE
ncbi:hypothetical protein AURDEDRAFT_177040 [Auricularia subglabra TFB-10046 SS5]|uniref:Uncharacterized protein n=1 Tax=Auricularia subglabra (strain TFB-10046 / SS5) TaxID=717982 RepID=J0WPT1_AURST|nr:hypothetical protein AURDEDRAFT_177040 [Auricularia subglabra TFB-10046 SS5]